MASNQNSGIRVLFCAESDGMVQIPVFLWAHHYEITNFGFWTILHKYVLFLAFFGKLLSIFVQKRRPQLHHQAEQSFGLRCFEGLRLSLRSTENNVTLTRLRQRVACVVYK